MSEHGTPISIPEISYGTTIQGGFIPDVTDDDDVEDLNDDLDKSSSGDSIPPPPAPLSPKQPQASVATSSHEKEPIQEEKVSIIVNQDKPKDEEPKMRSKDLANDEAPSSNQADASSTEAEKKLVEAGVFDYHLLSVSDLTQRLQTNIQKGVTCSKERLDRDGLNQPSVKAQDHDWERLATTKVTVRRDGQRKIIDARYLVIGDVVEVAIGPVLADMRLVECKDMLVDNQAITGDAEPQPRQIDTTSKTIFLAENLLFFGTQIVDGEGVGVVVGIGDATFLAQMLKDAAQHPKAKNKGKASGPKAKKSLMKLLAKKGMQFKSPSAAFQLGQITTLIVDAAGIITENKGSVNYVMIDGEIHDVASFPAEDPSFRALLRASVLGNNAVFQLSHSGKSKIDIDNLEVEDWDGTSGALLRFFEKHPLRGLEKKDSSPFYCEALRKAWPKVVEDVNDCFVSINKWSKDKENYDEQKGNFLVVMSGPTEVVIKHCTSYLQNGKKKPIDKNVEELIHEKYLTLTSYGDTVLAFAQLPLPKEKFPSGFEFDFYPPNFPLKELCFIGLVSMGSRYFKTVPSAVQKCKDAGVRLIMVSQDLPPAVTVLAKHVGLITHDTAEEIAKREGVSVAELGEEKLASISAVVLDGTQLGLMLDDGLSQILKSHSEVVIAGADSSHKLKIVRAAQKMGADQKVSVTGGQVGDCAALKAADVGIALPHSNDAVHCAADVVMTGGALDLIIECIELVRKKSEGGGCLLS